MAKRRKDKKAGTIKAEETAVSAEAAGTMSINLEKVIKMPPVEAEEQFPQKARLTAANAESGNAETVGPAYTKTGCRVSMATFIGGMFLTLVLGLYIGTLIPGMMRKETARIPAPGGQAETLAEAQPKAPEMDQHLKHTIADLEKKAAANMDSAPDWINLGNIYFDANMPAKAIQAYEHALRLAPGNADVLTDMGIMYRESGDFARAVEAFRKAIEIDPQHQNAMFNEGVVLLNDLQNKAEAAAAWQRLLDINPAAKAPNGEPLAEMISQLR